MCCFFTALFFFGPRLGFLVYWLIPIGRIKIFTAFSTWIWPLLGLIFLPWTTLMYVLVYTPGAGLVGFDWVWLALGFIADIASYGGGAYKRKEVPGYTGP
jgi:hypothetical protein